MPSEKSKNKRLRIVTGASDGTAPAPENRPALEVPTQDPGCPHCFGTGMEIVPEVGARRCRCQTPDHGQRLLQAARIPRRFQNCRLDNYDAGDSNPEVDSKWVAKTAAQNIFEHYLELDGRGLLLIGPVGVGKTHLAAAILIEMIERYKIRGLFYPFGALLKEIQDSYNAVSETSELSVLKPVFEAEVLVLDELGSQKTTDWVRETLMYIINSRYNDKRLTIFTTNYGDDPNVGSRISKLNMKLRDLQNLANESEPETEAILQKIRSLSEGTLEDRIGTALRSRLYEMCRTVVIEGGDYRKAMANSKA